MAVSLATDSCFYKELICALCAPRLQLMVADQKALFSRRLNQACDDAGEPKRGRRVSLARITGVSGEAARKWLSGESIPAMDHVAAIATHYNISAQWLLTGLREPEDKGVGSLTDEEMQHIKRLRCLPPADRARAFRVVDALVSPDVHKETA
jgi:transcriptional regulator with XRE-family HTH domain